jgi:ribosomal subunit interface protein
VLHGTRFGKPMTIKITGKNVEVSEAYSSFAAERIVESLEKYVGNEIAGHVRLEKERGRFRTSCSITLKSGMMLEAHGGGADAYASVDAAVEKLEKRVRRHRRRLKSHHHGGKQRQVVFESAGRDYTVELGEDSESSDAADNPVVIAENEFKLPELSVSEAVMQLDLTDSAFLLFRNAGSGTTNIVYRRQDGNVGWIEPNTGDGASRAPGNRRKSV